jgi:CBS domain containing-hemolysin-like protein
MGTALSLVASVALISANAFFVAVEFALVAVDRSAVELEVASGSTRAKLVSRSLSRLSFHLSGAQLGITVCSVLLGFVAAPALATLLQPLFDQRVDADTARTISVFVALALATMVQMVVGELVPKAVAVARPLETATGLALPTKLFVTVFRPVITVFGGAADRVVRALGIEPQEELSTVRSRSELAQVVRSSSDKGTIEEQEASLLTRVFRFGEKSVADVLTPRTAMTSLPDSATGADLLDAALVTGHDLPRRSG